MSSISIDDVKKLAQLSAVKLTDEDSVKIQAELSNILAFVEQIQSVDTEGVSPTYDVHYLENVLREDEIVEPTNSQDELLANTPKHQDGSIVVPRVLE